MEKLIVYHGPTCLDGLMSAAIMMMRFPHSEFMVGSYQSDIDYKKFRDREVIIVDFSYPRSVMKTICDIANRVIWLDHHATAIKEMKGFHHVRFFYTISESEYSGAGLAWKFCYPSEVMPEIVKAVQDRDLWKWERPNTAEITAALYSYEASVEQMYALLSKSMQSKTFLQVLKEQGEALVRAREKEVRLTINHGLRFIQIEGTPIPYINCNPSISSEVGNILAEDYKFVILWSDTAKHREFSLRSSKKNASHEDVGIIAKKFGGGGHECAAGFKYEYGKSPWEIE